MLDASNLPGCACLAHLSRTNRINRTSPCAAAQPGSLLPPTIGRFCNSCCQATTIPYRFCLCLTGRIAQVYLAGTHQHAPSRSSWLQGMRRTKSCRAGYQTHAIHCPLHPPPSWSVLQRWWCRHVRMQVSYSMLQQSPSGIPAAQHKVRSSKTGRRCKARAGPALPAFVCCRE